MRVALIGATGLVGRQALPLLEARHDLLVLARRPSGARRERVAPMEDWPRLIAGEPIEVAVSALGTTWRKAGNWDRFAAVDEHAVLAFAEAARAAGARQMITVSSSLADAGSRNAYLALKGRVEHSLGNIGFERLDILRPGLLVGKRGGDRRFKERIGIALSPVTNFFVPDRVAAIDAGLVAAAIAPLAGAPEHGIHVHHNREIRRLASGHI